MKLVSALLVGGGVFAAVKLLGRKEYASGTAPGDANSAASMPVPGGTPTTSPAGGDGGGVIGDPTIIPSTVAPSAGVPCTGCAGGGGGGAGSGGYLMTPPSVQPPVVRDHRGKRPVIMTAPGPTATKTTVACVRAPCPTSPRSGQTDPHGTSIHIMAAFANKPVNY